MASLLWRMQLRKKSSARSEGAERRIIGLIPSKYISITLVQYTFSLYPIISSTFFLPIEKIPQQQKVVLEHTSTRSLEIERAGG